MGVLVKMEEAPFYMPLYKSFGTPYKADSTWEIIYYPSCISLRTSICIVVTLKPPNLPLQNIFHYDVDMLVVSFDFAPRLGYPLRVRELAFYALCALALLEP